MREEWNTTPVKRYCLNCGKLLYGFRDAKGIVKVLCKHCGLTMHLKRVSRRHERVDVIPPPDVYIDN